MSFFTNLEKQLNLSINRTFSRCYKIERDIAGVPIIRNSKLSFKYRFTSNSRRLGPKYDRDLSHLFALPPKTRKL